ncbi:MAG: NAD(P)/FAD-dependent oxidoreductase [Pseudomonadota bacterium]
MRTRSVIIIGAGFSGLAAGIYARLNDYETHVLERQKKPGGVAATWRRGEFLCDGGVHFYTGFKSGGLTGDLYRELGLDQADQYLPLDNYARFLDPASGRQVDVSSDLDRFGDDLKKLSPPDGGFIDDFLQACRDFQGLDQFAALAKPPELTTWVDKARLMVGFRKVYPYFSGRWQLPVKTAAAGLHDPFLKGVFNNLFHPDVPLWFPAGLLGMLADGNLAPRRDGSAGFARALEKKYLDLGGRISYGVEVQRISEKNGRVMGVVLEDGETLDADRVIASGDGYNTLFNLLGGRFIHPKTREAHENWPLCPPMVMVHLGIDLDLSDQPVMTIFQPREKITSGFPAADWTAVRTFNYSPLFAPPGKTLVQVMWESRWRPWRELRDDLPAYQEEKERLAGEVVRALECFRPGISSTALMVDVSTPYTMWRRTLNREGAYLGFAVTAASISAEIRRTLPGLSHFYLAGQWTSPGGGVAPTLLTGRHAAMLLCRDDDRKFKTTAPTR